MKQAVFYTGLGALLTHELDAVAKGEWRVLPGLNALSDDVGMLVFIVLHVPIFALVVALVASERRIVRDRSRLAIAAFLVVHAGLHFFFRHHPEYQFSSLLSLTLIYGGAAAGGLYLLLDRLQAPGSQS